MIITPKNVQISAMLLIVLMIVTFITPPGLHIDFCFNEDGHFDISLHLCPEDASKPKTIKSEGFFKQSEHEDCTDVISDCNPVCDLLYPDGGARIINTPHNKQTLQMNQFKPGLTQEVADLSSTFSYENAFFIRYRKFPPSHLSDLNTVVLLN